MALPSPFIVGVARSGTTLLRFMLDRHPMLCILPETHFIPSLLNKYPTEQPLSRDSFRNFLTSHFAWPDFGLTVDELEHALANAAPFNLTDALRAFYRLYAHKNGKPGWGDKTPPYVEHIGAIARVLPEARFIHLIRDGRAIASSRRHLNFGPGKDVSAQAKDWKIKIRSARAQAAACPYYLEVRYEDLVTEPEGTLTRICRYLEIEFYPSLLDYQSSSRNHLDKFCDWRSPTGDVLSHGDYRRAIHHRTAMPLDPKRVGHWRTALTPIEIATFEATAGDLLIELGYSL